MAISILKEPSGIYPAYNDSFIEFQSSLIGDKRAEVTVFPTSVFTRTFVLYPDSQGRYLFNLKEDPEEKSNLASEEKNRIFEDAILNAYEKIGAPRGIAEYPYNDTMCLPEISKVNPKFDEKCLVYI